MKLRFAPSPTGNLHVGNVRTLLLNWLFAKKHNASFLLRFDDTDVERSKTEYRDQIKADMAWLGLTFDDEVQQSDRLHLYNDAAEKLKASGRLYPCYETKAELDFKRKRQLSQGKPPVYDRAALRLTPEDIKDFEDEGRIPHWRFKLDESATISWHDAAHGDISFEAKHFSDPILIRENGAPVYTLSGVVDDMDLNITHIVRGDDHISNTAIQIQLIEALGGKGTDFVFAHLPLLTGEGGEALSKRLGSLGIKDLRAEAFEAMAVVNYIGGLGNSIDHDVAVTMDEFVNTFSLETYGRSSPQFIMADLLRANEKYLHAVSFEAIQSRLSEHGFPNVTPAFWETVQGNLVKITDIKDIYKICYETIEPKIEDSEFIRIALKHLPHEPWSRETWQEWTEVIKKETGRKGKNLFMPLRQALTAEDHGPEMKNLLPFIGYEKASQRLLGQTA